MTNQTLTAVQQAAAARDALLQGHGSPPPTTPLPADAFEDVPADESVPPLAQSEPERIIHEVEAAGEHDPARAPATQDTVDALAQRIVLFDRMRADYEAGLSFAALGMKYCMSRQRAQQLQKQQGWIRRLTGRVVARREELVAQDVLDKARADEGARLTTEAATAPHRFKDSSGQPLTALDSAGLDTPLTPAFFGSLTPAKRRKTEKQAVDAVATEQAGVIADHKVKLAAALKLASDLTDTAAVMLGALKVLSEQGVRAIIEEACSILATSKEHAPLARSLAQLLRLDAQVTVLKDIAATAHRSIGGGTVHVTEARRVAHDIRNDAGEGDDGNNEIVKLMLENRGRRLKGGGGSAPPALPSPRSPVS